MAHDVPNPADLIYTPAQVSTLTLQALEAREQGKDIGLTLGIECVDKVLLPLLPTELVTVLADSGNYKTGLMQWVARSVAAQLDATGDECVVYVTAEIAVEESGLLDLGYTTGVDVAEMARGNISDWDSLRQAAIRRGVIPVYVFGHSIGRRKSRPILNMNQIGLALRRLEDDMRLHPCLILLDYLQRIAPDRGHEQVRLEFGETVNRAKDMALSFGSVVMMASQVKHDVSTRAWKLPTMEDGLETSTIKHASDKIIGCWRPFVTEGADAVVGKRGLKADKDLLILGIAKQKFGPTGDWWPLSVDFARNQIRGQMEMRAL